MDYVERVEFEKDKLINLIDLLNDGPKNILGADIYKKYGAHFPLLLKWLEANDVLSVQLHPSNSNPLLKENECGKPEAWLVLNVENNGYVYLGFKEGLSKEKIIECSKNDELEECLHKYKPKKFDYISVPTGCVHAVGPGVLVAEPQYVLPQKIAKTWRISDWKRLYDAEGRQSPHGKPRELHGEESFSAIDWDLPRGVQLEKLLIRNITINDTFVGDKNNPFALKIFSGSGEYNYTPLLAHSFSLFTVWSGQVTLSTAQETLRLKGGESGFICASNDSEHNVKVILEQGEENANIAFFALNESMIK